VRERSAILSQIADLLPEIMRKLASGRPIASGDAELTIGQVRALGVVADHSDCTMGQLARRLGVSFSAATELADRIVHAGLIEREADPSDRRLVRLRLSPAGRRARDTFLREERRRMEAALGHLSLSELEQILGGLDLLRQAFRSAQPPTKEHKE